MVALNKLKGGVIMKKLVGVIGILLIMALPWEFVLAQDLMVFPAKGQSQEQTEKDKFECYTWAKGQTGFDPMQVPTASSPPPPQTAGSVGGGAVKGGVGGGLLGLGVGAIAGGKSGAKKGAAIGGLSGAAIGGMRSHSQQQDQAQARQQWEQQQASQYAQKRGAYDRAYAACLEGKGYSVK
jgi:predicted lipid-binding transport protein (Tim44 family)